MEALVLDRDRRLRREPVGELLGLLVEGAVARRVEEQAADPVLVAAEPEAERPAAVLRVAGAHDLGAAADEARAGGAGRLDRALEDHGQERLGIVGGGERLTDERDGLADALLVRLRRTSRRAPPTVGLLGRRRLGGAAALDPGDHQARRSASATVASEAMNARLRVSSTAVVIGVSEESAVRRDPRALEQRGGDVAERLAALVGRAFLAGRDGRIGGQRPGRAERLAVVGEREDVHLEEAGGLGQALG